MGMNGRPEMLKEINIPGKPDRFGYNRAMAKRHFFGSNSYRLRTCREALRKAGEQSPGLGLE
jgi:hypothetical protein